MNLKKIMHLKKLNSRGFSHDILAVLFVMVFAVAGIGYMVYSHAATGWSSSNQWGSFVYANGSGVTTSPTHSQSSNLNLQYNSGVTTYHASDMSYYQYTLPASTTASSLTMN